MSRMVKFLSIAVILFSLAASASWYLQHQQETDPEPTKAAEEKPAKASAPHAKGPVAEAPSTRPPLIRPPISGEADKMGQMSVSLQQQQEALKVREQQLVDREKQTDLIHLEITKEQKKLDEVRKVILVELALVQEKLELLEKKTAEGDTQRKQIAIDAQDLSGKITEAKGLESNNLMKLSKVYDKMDPEAAAQNIEQMVEKGKLDTAVVILSNMGQRQVATLLAEVSKSEPSMAVQIIDRMRYFKGPQVSSKQ